MLLFCGLIILVPLTAIKAQVSSKQILKSSFVDNDIFKSAVFLENRDIIAPHNGEKVLYYVKHNHLNAFFTEKGVIYQLTSVDTNKVNELKEEKANEKLEKTNGNDKEKSDDADNDGPLPVITSVMSS